MVSVMRTTVASATAPRSTSHPWLSKKRRGSDMDVRTNRRLVTVIDRNAKPVLRQIVERPVDGQAMKHQHVAARVIARRPFAVVGGPRSLSARPFAGMRQQAQGTRASQNRQTALLGRAIAQRKPHRPQLG